MESGKAFVLGLLLFLGSYSQGFAHLKVGSYLQEKGRSDEYSFFQLFADHHNLEDPQCTVKILRSLDHQVKLSQGKVLEIVQVREDGQRDHRGNPMFKIVMKYSDGWRSDYTHLCYLSGQ